MIYDKEEFSVLPAVPSGSACRRSLNPIHKRSFDYEVRISGEFSLGNGRTSPLRMLIHPVKLLKCQSVPLFVGLMRYSSPPSSPHACIIPNTARAHASANAGSLML